MGEDTGIRQWVAALAVVAVLTCARATVAQAAQSASRGANSAGASGQGSDSGAEAAAYQKLNSGQVDEASAAFQGILAVHPNDVGALAGMGQVRMLQGNYLGAVSFLEQAKQASPGDAAISGVLDSARFRFLMGEGKDALTAKDSEDAEKRYREALELRPGDRQAVDALVNVLVAESKLSDAQDALSTAVANEASTTGHPPADLELQLAQLDIANSQPQLAYPIFLQVLQDSPDRVDAWSGLISALHLMGHDADAVAQENVIPAAARTQLEATPGFEQMMTAMASAPAQTAANGPSYEPFVPSEMPPPPAPAVAPPAPVTSTSAPAVASVPPVSTPQPNVLPPGNVPPATDTSRPVSVSPAPKPTVAAPSQTAKVPAMAAQTTTPARSAGNSGSSAPLVSQPAKRPPAREEVPDTGDQQYPQPKARPKPPASASNSNSTSAQNPPQ